MKVEPKLRQPPLLALVLRGREGLGVGDHDGGAVLHDEPFCRAGEGHRIGGAVGWTRQWLANRSAAEVELSLMLAPLEGVERSPPARGRRQRPSSNPRRSNWGRRSHCRRSRLSRCCPSPPDRSRRRARLAALSTAEMPFDRSGRVLPRGSAMGVELELGDNVPTPARESQSDAKKPPVTESPDEVCACAGDATSDATARASTANSNLALIGHPYPSRVQCPALRGAPATSHPGQGGRRGEGESTNPPNPDTPRFLVSEKKSPPVRAYWRSVSGCETGFRGRVGDGRRREAVG